MTSYRTQIHPPFKCPTMPDRSPSTDVKKSAREAVDALPDNSTWDDVMYHLYIRQQIDAGLRDAEAGRVMSVDEVRRRFGLAP